MNTQPILHGLTGKELYKRDMAILKALQEINKEFEDERKQNKQ